MLSSSRQPVANREELGPVTPSANFEGLVLPRTDGVEFCSDEKKDERPRSPTLKPSASVDTLTSAMETIEIAAKNGGVLRAYRE